MNVYNRNGRRIKRIFQLNDDKQTRVVVIYAIGYCLAYIISKEDAPVKLHRLRTRNTALEAVKAAIAAYDAGIPQNHRARYGLKYC